MENVRRTNPSRLLVLSQGKCVLGSMVQCECKFICVAASRCQIPCVFQRKCASQHFAWIPWVHFPYVFSGKMHLGFTSDCKFTLDAASPSRMRNPFPRKRALQESCQIGKRAVRDCKLPFVSKPGRRPSVYKRALQVVKAMMLGDMRHNCLQNACRFCTQRQC